MGTRADFYVGRGADAEWLGSIAFDGWPGADGTGGMHSDEYPHGAAVLRSESEADFRDNIRQFFAEKGDQVTVPGDGWPWPWETSATTDYAYAFVDGKVWASCFGHEWFDPLKEQPEDDTPKSAIFPNMSDRAAVTLGKRSGLIVTEVRGS